MTRTFDTRGWRALIVWLGLFSCGTLVSGQPQGAPPSKDAMSMGSPPSLPTGYTVESMWPAPTAEDWKLPCPIHWQRSFEDALAIARQTSQPILVCVNMDGEPASEHFAGVRYRQADTAKLMEPYVCLIASVYRHTARDYDAQGNRVLCPRFGSVTCGEHIAIETALYDKYFEGTRVSPRHILLEPSGAKGYDVYYSWDTATVFTAFRAGVKDRPPVQPLAHDGIPLVERTASADIVDRTAVETTYLSSNRSVRRTLLDATLTHRDIDQIDLLRLAIFGLDVDLARLARKALAQCDSEGAVDLIAETLKLPMEQAEREELLAAVDRLGQKYPRARTLVAVHQGLAEPSKFIDVQDWSRATAALHGAAANETDALRGAPTSNAEAEYRASAGGAYGPAAHIESRAADAEAHPADGAAQLALAESMLARGEDPSTEKRFAALLFEDARNKALEAEKLGAKGWRIDAVLAVTANARGEREQAIARALAAVEGGMPRPGTGADGLQERTAVTVLALFAQARQQAIAKAYHERKPWPPEWLADIHAAYAVLVAHPLGSDQNVADCYDFLRWLGATPRAVEALDAGLARFPESWLLHQRLRARILWDSGPDGLEAAYTAMLAQPNAAPALEWFAGFASLVAAENHRREGAADKALGAYERGIAHYQHDIEIHPDHRASADHYVALARAGRARIELEQGDVARATSDILAAFEGSPEAAAALDGLSITPVDTARMLLAKLEQSENKDLAAELQAGLDALDPHLLDLPDLQRGVPNEAARAGDRRPPRPPGGG